MTGQDGLAGSDEAAWKVRLRQQVAEAALDRHDDDLSLVRLVAINDAFPLIEAAVRAEAVAEKARLIGVNQSLYADLLRAEGRIAEAVAEERQRIIELVGDMCTYRERDGRALPHPHPADHLGPCPYGQVVGRVLAAGSVPVATPPTTLQRRLFEECEAAGWDPDKQNTFAEECAHLHEEVSEAFREWRLHKNFDIRSDESGKPTGIPIELADVLIGLFYNAELHGFDLLAAVEVKHRWNLTRNYQAEGRTLHPVATPAEPDGVCACGVDSCTGVAPVGAYGPEVAAEPSAGTGTPAATMGPERPGLDLRGARRSPEPSEPVSGGSGHAERQEPAGEAECENPRCVQIAATASDVYCEITGGLLSYPTYDAQTILAHASDEVDKLVGRETAELRAEVARLGQERDNACAMLRRAENESAARGRDLDRYRAAIEDIRQQSEQHPRRHDEPANCDQASYEFGRYYGMKLSLDVLAAALGDGE